MKILTFSDLHGRFTARAAQTIREQSPDWIVLAGDMLPDFSMLGHYQQAHNQGSNALHSSIQTLLQLPHGETEQG